MRDWLRMIGRAARWFARTLAVYAAVAVACGLAFLALAFVWTAVAGVSIDGNGLTFSLPRNEPPPDILDINRPGGELVVRIRADGSVEYGPGYKPDEAARLFWDAMAGEAKCREGVR